MASFFGEVRPLSSRAVDDEEADNQPKYNLSFENFDNKKEFKNKVKLMIFSIGEIASIFVKSYFMPENSDLISSVKYSCENKDDDSTFYTSLKSNKDVKDAIAASIYLSSPNILICDISNTVPDEICYDVTEMIFNTFRSSEFLILASQHMATYKTESSTSYDAPFLRRLCTAQYLTKHSCSIPRLDSPNFLSNMPASLMLKCELYHLPTMCIVNFVDTGAIDSLNVHVFDEVLNQAIVSKVPVNPDSHSKVIKYVKAKQSVESNLYM